MVKPGKTVGKHLTFSVHLAALGSGLEPRVNLSRLVSAVGGSGCSPSQTLPAIAPAPGRPPAPAPLWPIADRAPLHGLSPIAG